MDEMTTSKNISIKLSVIVPVYNVEQYIRRSLDSLIMQAYKNLEIILVDDGSTDKSGRICDEYAVLDSRIKVIHKDNGGIVSARKAAINEATGEYVINFDSDDWIEVDAYEQVVKIIEKYHPDIVAFGYTKEFEGFSELYPIEYEEGYYTAKEFWRIFNDTIENNLFFKQPIDMSQWSKAIKTDIARKHQLSCSEQLRKNVDDMAIFPCLMDIDNIYILSGCWYHYCVRKNSILWKSGDEDYKRYLLLAKHLIECVNKARNGKLVSKRFILYKLIHHMMLDVPEKLFRGDSCLIYPELTPESNIIVYGKGVFANRIMSYIREKGYCNIVDNIDTKDIDRLNAIDVESYDYIVVAVFNSRIVTGILKTLEEYGIERSKVLIIEKDNLMADILPEAIRTGCQILR